MTPAVGACGCSLGHLPPHPYLLRCRAHPWLHPSSPAAGHGAAAAQAPSRPSGRAVGRQTEAAQLGAPSPCVAAVGKRAQPQDRPLDCRQSESASGGRHAGAPSLPVDARPEHEEEEEAGAGKGNQGRELGLHGERLGPLRRVQTEDSAAARRSPLLHGAEQSECSPTGHPPG